MQPVQSSAVCCTARVGVVLYVNWQMTFCFMIAEDTTVPEEDEQNVAKNKRARKVQLQSSNAQ